MDPASFLAGFVMFILGALGGDYCAKNPDQCKHPSPKPDAAQVHVIKQ